MGSVLVPFDPQEPRKQVEQWFPLSDQKFTKHKSMPHTDSKVQNTSLSLTLSFTKTLPLTFFLCFQEFVPSPASRPLLTPSSSTSSLIVRETMATTQQDIAHLQNTLLSDIQATREKAEMLRACNNTINQLTIQINVLKDNLEDRREKQVQLTTQVLQDELQLAQERAQRYRASKRKKSKVIRDLTEQVQEWQQRVYATSEELKHAKTQLQEQQNEIFLKDKLLQQLKRTQSEMQQKVTEQQEELQRLTAFTVAQEKKRVNEEISQKLEAKKQQQSDGQFPHLQQLLQQAKQDSSDKATKIEQLSAECQKLQHQLKQLQQQQQQQPSSATTQPSSNLLVVVLVVLVAVLLALLTR